MTKFDQNWTKFVLASRLGSSLTQVFRTPEVGVGKARDAYGLVVRGLREDLRLGLVSSGAVFHIAELAERFSTSGTPVREALARLAGEGLVDDDGGPGHRAPGFDGREACDHYGLQGLLIDAALTKARPPSSDARQAGAAAWRRRWREGHDRELALLNATSSLFAQMMTDAQDVALEGAFRRNDARLGLLRRAEARLLPDLDEELQELAHGYEVQSPDLTRLCRRYHQRRFDMADLIASGVSC